MAKQAQHAPAAEGASNESRPDSETPESALREPDEASSSSGVAEESPAEASPATGAAEEAPAEASPATGAAEEAPAEASPANANSVEEAPEPVRGVEALQGPGLGELLGFSERGYPVISLGGDDDAVEVPTTVELTRDDVGSRVLVTFVDGRVEQPIVTGRLLPPGPVEPPGAQSSAKSSTTLSVEGPLQVEDDGETVTIEAGRELVLRCGQASIRLRRDGRVEVRGVDVVSRASRANWIKGGSVALN